MSDDPIDDLRSTLLRAARRRTSPWWRRRGVLLGLGGVLVVAAPAAGAIGGLWHPEVAPPPPAVTTVATATSATSGRCIPTFSGKPGGTTTEPLPPRMAAAFGVLRRPQTARDRRGIRFARPMTSGRLAAYAIRRLGDDAQGSPKFLVPSLLVVRARPATAHCPARATTRTWMLAVAGRSGGGLDDYERFIEHGTFGTSGTDDRSSTVSGVAPDGVASVTVTYGRAAPRTFPVTNDFFTYRVALPAEQLPTSVVWNDRAGKAIKRVR